MHYLNKHQMKPIENYQLAKANLVHLIRMTARLEDIVITVPQVQAILKQQLVEGVSVAKVNTIKQLAEG